MRGLIFIALIGVLLSCEYNSFEVEDIMDCSSSNLNLQATQIINSNCGLENGSIKVTATGGLTPYTFSLDGQDGQVGQSESEFVGLAATNYLISVTDENGCEQQIEVTIQNIDGVNALVSSTEAGCEMNQGAITVTASNGVEPYMYQVDAGSFQLSNQFSGLDPGVHTIVVNDANNCSITLQERVFSGVSFTVSISDIISTNCALPNCHGGTQSPDFRIFSNIQANSDKIRSRTQSRSMPRGRSLTQNQIDLIACWVDDGALAN